MNYPLHLTFKLLALASQIYIRDANGELLGYVKQKMFKLKEDINVFADEGQTNILYNIKADRVLDFSATYNFTSSDGKRIGAVRRRGMRSLFKAHYEVYDSSDTQVMQISEANGWIKVADALLGEVPVLGMFTGYFFNPAYNIARMDGPTVAILKKEPSFLESGFSLSSVGSMTPEEETRVLLSTLTMTLLERSRG